MRWKSTLVGVVALVGLAAPVDAQTIDNADSGLTSPATALTFGEVGLTYGQAVTTQFLAGYGVTFSGGWYYNTGDAFAGSTGGMLYNWDNSATTVEYYTPLSVIFDNAVAGAAFQFRTNPGVSTFTAYLNGVEVSSFDAATDAATGATQWFGFTGDVVLDELKIDVGGSNHAMNFDNLQAGSAADVVPEPATVALMFTGLAGLGLVGLRRRREDRGEHRPLT